MLNQSYQSLVNTNRLSNNEEYYINVFKKTERIISAIEYVLSFILDSHPSKGQVNTLHEASATLHKVALESLGWYEAEGPHEVYHLQHALVVLDSTLRVATAGRVLGADATEAITQEIDTVLRYLKHHFVNTNKPLNTHVSAQVTAPAAPRMPAVRRPRVVVPKNDLSSDAVLVYSQLSDRTTRIKTVLEAKPEATIKDITDIITDVSAKTIQRDLNAMIADGEVMRQGERRWSRYSIIK